MKTVSHWKAAVAVAAAFVLSLIPCVNAAVILEDTMNTSTYNGTTAILDAWDTVDGINSPSTTLVFLNGSTSASLGYIATANVPAGEVLPGNNMTAGGWDMVIDLVLDGSTPAIDLSSLVLDLRLTNSSGADNTTASKNGTMTAVVTGSISGVLGSVTSSPDTYPSVEYQRTLDLSSLANLTATETYTLTIEARGAGFGHFKSLQGLQLNGSIIPEPASLILLGLGSTIMLMRRRK